MRLERTCAGKDARAPLDAYGGLTSNLALANAQASDPIKEPPK